VQKYSNNFAGATVRDIRDNSIIVYRPDVTFNIRRTEASDKVVIEFETYDEDMVLLYYPGACDPFDLERFNDSRYTVQCLSINEITIVVSNLASDIVYTFCALYLFHYQMMTPFQCKSFVISTGVPWFYQEQKTIIITSFALLLLLSLIIGIIMTYILIWRVPTLMKRSKRIIIVGNNRPKEVMILPSRSSSSGSQVSSCRKESITPTMSEPPTYLTPLPRSSFKHRLGLREEFCFLFILNIMFRCFLLLQTAISTQQLRLEPEELCLDVSFAAKIFASISARRL
jgi:hypothetical protein